MRQSIFLQVTYEGTVPGLEAGALSIADFNESFAKLLIAYRKIAVGIIADAGTTRQSKKSGPRADNFDLQITAITHQSPLTVHMRCATRSGSEPLLHSEGVLQEAAKTLLRSIHLESGGTPRDLYVRRYLKTLPKGVRSQNYRLTRDSEELDKLSVSEVHLPEQVEWPYIDNLTASITGVGFEPGNLEVRLKGIEGKPFNALASRANVDRAIALRGQTVTASVWKESGERVKLIGVRPSDTPTHSLSHEEAKAIVFREWDEALRRLAQ